MVAFYQKPRFTPAHQQVLQALGYMGEAVLVRYVTELRCAAGLHALVRISAGQGLPQWESES